MNLSELKNLDLCATPGPWKLIIPEWADMTFGIDGPDGTPIIKPEPRSSEFKGITNDADARLIVALRNMASELIASIELIRNDRNALTIWTIYEKPKDFPNSLVARRWKISAGGKKATDCIIIGQTLEEVRNLLPYGLTIVPRETNDDPCIVESWI